MSYIKGTARVVNRVPTLQLGQVRRQAPLTPPYMVISISYANNTFQRSPNTRRLFQVQTNAIDRQYSTWNVGKDLAQMLQKQK